MMLFANATAPPKLSFLELIAGQTDQDSGPGRSQNTAFLFSLDARVIHVSVGVLGLLLVRLVPFRFVQFVALNSNTFVRSFVRLSRLEKNEGLDNQMSDVA